METASSYMNSGFFSKQACYYSSYLADMPMSPPQESGFLMRADAGDSGPGFNDDIKVDAYSNSITSVKPTSKLASERPNRIDFSSPVLSAVKNSSLLADHCTQSLPASPMNSPGSGRKVREKVYGDIANQSSIEKSASQDSAWFISSGKAASMDVGPRDKFRCNKSDDDSCQSESEGSALTAMKSPVKNKLLTKRNTNGSYISNRDMNFLAPQSM